MQPIGAKAHARKPLHGRLQPESDRAPPPVLSTQYQVSSTQYPLPWRLTRLLASRGTLAIYRAAANGDLGPGCYVLKTVARDRSQPNLSLALLQREATVANNVSQANLTALLAAEFTSPQPYLLLPYLEGVTLHRLLHSEAAALPIAFTLGILRQIASALAALHAAGWLHGQVRPDHFIVSPQGQATLIDLTLVRRLESSECDSANLLPPAPRYAAPEQFSSRQRLTSAADIYSLGITLYESLTGRPPFSAVSPRELAHSHCREIPPDLRQIRSDASFEVAELCRRMLAKEPLRRPAAGQVVRWLAELEIAELAL